MTKTIAELIAYIQANPDKAPEISAPDCGVSPTVTARRCAGLGLDSRASGDRRRAANITGAFAADTERKIET